MLLIFRRQFGFTLHDFFMLPQWQGCTNSSRFLLTVQNFMARKIHIFLQSCRFNGVFSLLVCVSLSPSLPHHHHSSLLFPSVFLSVHLPASVRTFVCVSQSPRQMTTPVRRLPTTQSGQTSKYTTLVSDDELLKNEIAGCRSISDFGREA